MEGTIKVARYEGTIENLCQFHFEQIRKREMLWGWAWDPAPTCDRCPSKSGSSPKPPSDTDCPLTARRVLSAVARLDHGAGVTAGEATTELKRAGVDCSRYGVKKILDDAVRTGRAWSEVRPCVRNGREVQGAHYHSLERQ